MSTFDFSYDDEKGLILLQLGCKHEKRTDNQRDSAILGKRNVPVLCSQFAGNRCSNEATGIRLSRYTFKKAWNTYAIEQTPIIEPMAAP